MTDGHACRLCGAHDGSLHHVREMMHGTRTPYLYFHCRACGCLHLAQQVDPEEQYPPRYYAYHLQPRPTGFRLVLRRLRNRGVFEGNRAGLLLNRLFPYPVYGAESWFPANGITRSSRILDVGCGSAEIVRDLLEIGFEHVDGIEPFLPDTAIPLLPPSVHKAWLHEWPGDGSYDLLMFHHVLEHMPDQFDALRHAARLLRSGGMCLVRVPVLPNDAWDAYRENWVQIDAPRHHVIHSHDSLRRMAERAGLALQRVQFDSTAFQFAGSELYVHNRPLSELPQAYSKRAMRGFARRARTLNARSRGDQAAYVFVKG